MRLKDKVAIVTGGGSGFGEGIATRFAREGAKVLIADVNAQAGARVAREIGAQFVAADVTQSADWAKLVQAAGPSLEIVINNAGWTHRNKPYLEVTESEFDKVYAVNVKSVYLSALHAVPVFRRRGGGGFVNIASTAGIRPRPGLTVYNSSKGAVILMSKSMAAEFGPDRIRVNCVNPVFSPQTLFAATPCGPFGMDHFDFLGWLYEGGGLDMYWEFYRDVLKLNIVAFPIGGASPQAFGWFKRP